MQFTSIVQISPIMRTICNHPKSCSSLTLYAMFYAMIELLCSDKLDPRRDVYSQNSKTGHYLALVSDFGWSLHFSTLTLNDPAATPSGLLYVRQGVPTKSKTEERRSLIRDGVKAPQSSYPDSNHHVLDRGLEFRPRCAAPSGNMSEYWTLLQQEIELRTYFLCTPAPEWENAESPLEQSLVPRKMHDALWEPWFTPACKHEAIRYAERSA